MWWRRGILRPENHPHSLSYSGETLSDISRSGSQDMQGREDELRTNRGVRRRINRIALVLVLAGALVSVGLPQSSSEESVLAAEESEVVELTDRMGIGEGESHLPGVTLAEGISQLTGVAISPLLGVSVVGGWTYLRADDSVREELPWICHPAFWGTGFGLLLIIFFKDSLGAMGPAFLKKPLDFLEVFEDKFSALIAASAFVPFLLRQQAAYRETFSEVLEGGQTAASALGDGTAALAVIPGPFLATAPSVWLFLPIALAGFFVVWIVSHALTVVIALSPFRFFDLVAKLARLSLLGLMGVLYLVSPVLVAIFSVLLIIACAFLAPAAFRLSVFGTVVGWDFIRTLFHDPPLDTQKLRCFLAKDVPGTLTVRSMGKVEVVTEGDHSGIEFRSRFGFVGLDRRLKLPPTGELVLQKGLLFPVLQFRDPESARTVTLLQFLPRFRHCSDDLADHLGIPSQETAVVRGYQAAKDWVADNVRSGKQLLTTGESFFEIEDSSTLPG